MEKNNLDERQTQKRNQIGNQAFLLLTYLLFIDIGLHGFGVKWLAYPTNVFVILLACLFYYLIRTIWHDAYVGPKVKSGGMVWGLIAGFVTALIVGVVAHFLDDSGVIKRNDVVENDNGAMILFILSLVALAITGVVSWIAKRRRTEKE